MLDNYRRFYPGCGGDPCRRRKKGEGRAAEVLADQLGVSPSTVYQAQKILKFGSPELVERVRNGEIVIKKASKGLKMKEAG